MPASGCYFAMYEFSKRSLKEASGTEDLKFWQVLVAGGMAGWANWAWAVPPDVIKTRYQTGMASSKLDTVLQEQ